MNDFCLDCGLGVDAHPPKRHPFRSAVATQQVKHIDTTRSYANRYGTLVGRLQAREQSALDDYRDARACYLDGIVWHHHGDLEEKRRRAFLNALLCRTRWSVLHSLLHADDATRWADFKAAGASEGELAAMSGAG